ncbi:hypothetical protein GALL_505520 [mine drainage metagenome]|uniref:Uncharacterized protein n=1 Tax=mine drainage metagenome TaxID=410659 RepID=A0A1J5P9J2_9ZZZZ
MNPVGTADDGAGIAHGDKLRRDDAVCIGVAGKGDTAQVGTGDTGQTNAGPGNPVGALQQGAVGTDRNPDTHTVDDAVAHSMQIIACGRTGNGCPIDIVGTGDEGAALAHGHIQHTVTGDGIEGFVGRRRRRRRLRGPSERIGAGDDDTAVSHQSEGTGKVVGTVDGVAGNEIQGCPGAAISTGVHGTPRARRDVTQRGGGCCRSGSATIDHRVQISGSYGCCCCPVGTGQSGGDRYRDGAGSARAAVGAPVDGHPVTRVVDKEVRCGHNVR